MATLKEAIFDPLGTSAGTAESRIDKVYERYESLLSRKPRALWDSGQPNPLQADALAFLTNLKRDTGAESKKATALQADRGLALDTIEQFVKRVVGTGCPAFPHIDPYRFAMELALRVRRPRSINQRQTVLCGAAGIMSAYFKTDPKRATSFALDLVETGAGNLRQYRIEPQGRVKNEPPPDRFEMAPVDWVLLASLRYHFEPLAELIGLFSAEAADPLRQLTKPGLLYSALKNMGYTTVADRTFGLDTFSTSTNIASAITRYRMHGQSEASRGEGNLRLAEGDVAAGKLVFLWSYGDLTTYTPVRSKGTAYPSATKTPAKAVDAIGFPSLHWTLIRKLSLSSTEIKIRHYSWGDAREATFPKDEFLNVYQGHVMADPA